MDELKRLNIEITSVCNYLCTGCPNPDDILLRGNKHMSPDLFKKIFDEVGDELETIYLWNYGDPLLHPKIPELLEYSGNFKAKKIISTTGFMLSNFNDLSFMNNVDETIISINGLDQETYEFHQKGGDLNRVLEGVYKLNKFRDPSSKLILQYVVNKENIYQLSQLESFGKEHGFDEVVLKSFNVMDHKEETLKKYVPIEDKFSRYTEGSLKNAPSLSDVDFPCLNWFVINYDGSVNPCCWDYKGEFVFGNVNVEGVKGVWNNYRSEKNRNDIKEGRFLNICGDCTTNTDIARFNLLQ